MTIKSSDYEPGSDPFGRIGNAEYLYSRSVIQEIAESIYDERGLIDDGAFREWASAYTHWGDAADQVTPEDVESILLLVRQRIGGAS